MSSDEASDFMILSPELSMIMKSPFSRATAEISPS